MRELDELYGVMPRAADAAAIQFRTLHASRSPAVRGPHAQCDRAQYCVPMSEQLSNHSTAASLTLRDGAAHSFILDVAGHVAGIHADLPAAGAAKLRTPAAVRTAGPFLNGGSLAEPGDSMRLIHPSHSRFSAARLNGSLFEERNPFLERYCTMYGVLRMPYIGNIFLEDRVFSRLRVAGYNPLSLFRVDSAGTAPLGFETERMPAEGDTLVAAEQHLYALNFSAMSGVTQN